MIFYYTTDLFRKIENVLGTRANGGIFFMIFPFWNYNFSKNLWVTGAIINLKKLIDCPRFDHI